MLDPSEEEVVARELLGCRALQDARLTEGGERREGIATKETGDIRGVRELQALREKLDIAQAAQSRLHVRCRQEAPREAAHRCVAQLLDRCRDLFPGPAGKQDRRTASRKASPIARSPATGRALSRACTSQGAA